ncbi:hypothetical protein ABW19_dt0205175 [Dactylella cylindrospora]|nr:hypothetical protein ABW19_dt0205175 [Dactylella cylindrospora]
MATETAAAPTDAPASKPTVTLYAFEKQPGTPTASGFCQKIECYFRFSDIKYTQIDTLPFKAPKKKLPYVTIEETTIADSQFIIRHMKANGIADLDKSAGLTEYQIAESLAYRGFWEEGIYPGVVMSRWCVKENEPVIAQEVFGDLPFFVRIPLRWWFRRSITHALLMHGIGRHNEQELYVILREALLGLETRLSLANKTFAESDVAETAATKKVAWFHATATPSDIDTVMSAMLINLVGTESNHFCKNVVLKSAVLRDYVKMVVEGYFPEFVKVLKEIEEAEKKDLEDDGK